MTDLVGVAEIAEMFPHRYDPTKHMAPESVSRWLHEGTIPEPDAVLAAGPVWIRERIVEWANETGRRLR